uniref:Uncharacterized protein n=1 Tax=Panagrolaimus davidi TaxID=227884 RepID=A0A914Q384_9BILA
MKYPNAKVKDAEGNVDVPFESCTPKMVDDKIVELYVYIDASCSIIVKNAEGHVQIIPTTTTKVPPEHSPEHSISLKFPWWGWLTIEVPWWGMYVFLNVLAYVQRMIEFLTEKLIAKFRLFLIENFP